MSEELPEEVCKNCRFRGDFVDWEKDMEPPVEWFQCRRRPPVLVNATLVDNGDFRAWSFPYVFGSDWCGEFQPRKDTP